MKVRYSRAPDRRVTPSVERFEERLLMSAAPPGQTPPPPQHPQPVGYQVFPVALSSADGGRSYDVSYKTDGSLTQQPTVVLYWATGPNGVNRLSQAGTGQSNEPLVGQNTYKVNIGPLTPRPAGATEVLAIVVPKGLPLDPSSVPFVLAAPAENAIDVVMVAADDHNGSSNSDANFAANIIQAVTNPDASGTYTNLQNLVSGVDAILDNQHATLRSLTIIDHGAPNAQFVGTDFLTTDRSGNLELTQNPSLAQSLASLNTRFDKAAGPTLVLDGCEVGQGSALTSAISLLLPGVAVKAYSAYQVAIFPPRGGVRSSLNGQSTYSGPTSNDYFDRYVLLVLDRIGYLSRQLQSTAK